jgi:hypothetical protein
MLEIAVTGHNTTIAPQSVLSVLMIPLLSAAEGQAAAVARLHPPTRPCDPSRISRRAWNRIEGRKPGRGHQKISPKGIWKECRCD